MAAKKQPDPREAEYLTDEDATSLWVHIESTTNFTRRVLKKPSLDNYHQRLLYLLVAAVYRSLPRVIRKRS